MKSPDKHPLLKSRSRGEDSPLFDMTIKLKNVNEYKIFMQYSLFCFNTVVLKSR